MNTCIDTYIPIREARSINGLPWINQEIRRLMGGRRSIESARPGPIDIQTKRSSSSTKTWCAGYQICLTRNIAGIFLVCSKVNTKNHYSLLKHSRQDNSGTTSLKANEQKFNSNTDKVNTLNQQFQSHPSSLVLAPCSPQP